MSDDLVSRLRDRGVCSLAHNSCRNDFVCEQAADRIEELEAKLEKAVEAAVLQSLHAAASEANYACGCKDAIYAINPAHLAELKGDTNE